MNIAGYISVRGRGLRTPSLAVQCCDATRESLMNQYETKQTHPTQSLLRGLIVVILSLFVITPVPASAAKRSNSKKKTSRAARTSKPSKSTAATQSPSVFGAFGGIGQGLQPTATPPRSAVTPQSQLRSRAKNSSPGLGLGGTAAHNRQTRAAQRPRLKANIHRSLGYGTKSRSMQLRKH